jgi:hypothetical protein
LNLFSKRRLQPHDIVDIVVHIWDPLPTLCGLLLAQYALAWHRIRQMSQEDIKVEALVVGANRGGLIVSVDHIRGFIPGSHLTQVGGRKKPQPRHDSLMSCEACNQPAPPDGSRPAAAPCHSQAVQHLLCTCG